MLNTNVPYRNKTQFVILLDAQEGNLNGDPDNSGAPRRDPLTGIGIVTGVSFKRKLRDYVLQEYADVPGFGIRVKDGVNLTAATHKIAEDSNVKYEKSKSKNGKKPKVVKEDRGKALRFASQRNWDDRMFGCTLFDLNETSRGPLQIENGRSFDPIEIRNLTITACAKMVKAEDGKEADDEIDDGTMGRMSHVAYGLYYLTGEIYFQPDETVAKITYEDVFVFLEAVVNSLSLSGSVQRGRCFFRGIHFFRHIGTCEKDTRYGAAKAQLFRDLTSPECLIQIRKREGVDVPLSIQDYEGLGPVPSERIPSGIEYWFLEDYADVKRMREMLPEIEEGASDEVDVAAEHAPA